MMNEASRGAGGVAAQRHSWMDRYMDGRTDGCSPPSHPLF